MTQISFPVATAPSPEAERSTASAMRRGARRRCPACGEGPLFQGYLQIRHHCPACGEAMHHHRADDGPAYLTILLLAHLMSPALLVVYLIWQPSVPAMLVGFLSVTLALSLILLPIFKGGFVGLQWARRMHGFGRGEASVE